MGPGTKFNYVIVISDFEREKSHFSISFLCFRIFRKYALIYVNLQQQKIGIGNDPPPFGVFPETPQFLKEEASLTRGEPIINRSGHHQQQPIHPINPSHFVQPLHPCQSAPDVRSRGRLGDNEKVPI